MPPCPTVPTGGSASSSSRGRSARSQRVVIEPGQVGPKQRTGPRRRTPLEAEPVAISPAPHADRGDVGAHQRCVMGIVVVTLGDDFGGDLLANPMIGAEMGECRIAAQHFTGMHAHDAAAERIVYAVFD